MDRSQAFLAPLAALTVMCNLYSITTNQAAIIALFRIVSRYIGNLQATPGVCRARNPQYWYR